MRTLRSLGLAAVACLAATVAYAQGSGAPTPLVYSGPPSLRGYSPGVASYSTYSTNHGVSVYRGTTYSGSSHINNGFTHSSLGSGPFSDFPTVGWSPDANPFSDFPTIGWSPHSSPFSSFPTIGW
jgi:hypothetical protein